MKFSHFIFFITFILSLVIILALGNLKINDDYQKFISVLHEKGHTKLKNQMTQIDDSLSIITNYTKSLAKEVHEKERYDEERLSKTFENLFLKELGVFQLRLLSEQGMELIRYDLNKDLKIVKSQTLQDKSTRYYIQESRYLKRGEVYISKLDLNEENGKIEKPYKKTIRVVEKVTIADKRYFIVINFDLTTILKTALDTTLYNLFFVEKDGQINMHLDDDYAFSFQQNKNLYWHDFLNEEDEFIAQKKLKFLPYDVLISLKKSKITSLKESKQTILIEMMLIALLISFILSSMLYYFLNKHLQALSNNVLNIMKNKNEINNNNFQEFTDILEKVKSQQVKIENNMHKLKNQKEFTNAIINSQSNFLLITDGVTLKESNKSMLDFFNYASLEEFNNAHDCICDFFIPEKGYLVKEKNGKTWLEFVLEDISKPQKIMMADIHGNRHIFQIFTRSLKDNDDNFVLSLTDITELNALQTSLEERVEKQVQELREQEHQLMQQSRLAQMGEMISMIAHQWRQPLSAITATTGNLNLKLMMDDVDKEEFEQEITRIEDYAQHLSKTIDDFRGFFKENKVKELTSLNEIVESTLNIAKISAENKNITIKTDLHATTQIETFASELKQVLLNLIKNSEDALIENEIENPTIMIKTSVEDSVHVLQVKDNGGGIPADVIGKIFDPYFSTKLEKDGTGLGLYMSKTIIQEHCKGSISVENDANGAIFTIKIKGEDA